MKCDLEDVWQAVQDLCADSKGRLLFVIDNIENIGNDEFLGKLSMLPCRVLITSRQKILRGFNRIMYLPPLKMAQCRDLFYQHYQYADDIFEYIITTSEQMSSDYLPDVADFLFNYARCLHDQDEDEKAKAQYLKCINIWSEMSEDGNRKLALAHQEIADIFFSENNAADALEHYVLAEKFNAEDFYVEVDVLDSVAACLLLLDKPEEGIQKFKELLEILVKYKANDTEAKFQLCNNLFCIIDAESEEEIELREMLMEQIKDEPATVEYVHNFLTNREEK